MELRMRIVEIEQEYFINLAIAPLGVLVLYG